MPICICYRLLWSCCFHYIRLMAHCWFCSNRIAKRCKDNFLSCFNASLLWWPDKWAITASLIEMLCHLLARESQSHTVLIWPWKQLSISPCTMIPSILSCHQLRENYCAMAKGLQVFELKYIFCMWIHQVGRHCWFISDFP